ncbi:hypothetical protein SAMN05444008_10917 [Cnuella takakiae]|uniref:Uncharacterized protein n=1 Tax=Cnuella takakiae TaxID=1302690 RepID=A0A1M5CE64_9BACT|nr:hypothetical protein [Cnuella takakiae]OLY91771.1 hypothetical protein BUE76_07570 [Cnuella takakiae]SHF52722.1 hypothetical protein SAMN05444008_10917 [Cnuella takakiae]
MTPVAFNALDTSEQIKIAMRGDALVGHRSEGPRSMHLYAVEQFYVEVEFTTRRKDVLRVYASDGEDILNPYLEQIDISELWW